MRRNKEDLSRCTIGRNHEPLSSCSGMFREKANCSIIWVSYHDISWAENVKRLSEITKCELVCRQTRSRKCCHHSRWPRDRNDRYIFVDTQLGLDPSQSKHKWVDLDCLAEYSQFCLDGKRTEYTHIPVENYTCISTTLFSTPVYHTVIISYSIT